MRAVRDGRDDLVVLLDRSDGTARLLDPETGAERTVPADRLEPVVSRDAEGHAPDEAVGHPPATRRLLAAVDARGLALLVVLDAGPRRVRELLDTLACCESDLHGLVADLRAAGLVEPADVGGERGYRTTEAASAGLAGLRSWLAGRA